jgi:hypothetical protein
MYPLNDIGTLIDLSAQNDFSYQIILFIIELKYNRSQITLSHSTPDLNTAETLTHLFNNKVN